MGLEPQGNYAILIQFDDLHETGIYSWEYLYHLGKNKTHLMRQYVRNLKQQGKSRDPRAKAQGLSKPKESANLKQCKSR